jgi:hypothetical protein
MSNVNRRIETITSDTATAYERGFRAPFNGKIMSVGLAVNVAVTTATSNLKAQIDNTDVTGAAFAVTTGRAVGYTEKQVPTALLSFREGQYLSVVGDGGGDAGNCSVTFELQED